MLRRLFPAEFPILGQVNPPIPSQVFHIRHMQADPILFERNVLRLANTREMRLFNDYLMTQEEIDNFHANMARESPEGF